MEGSPATPALVGPRAQFSHALGALVEVLQPLGRSDLIDPLIALQVAAMDLLKAYQELVEDNQALREQYRTSQDIRQLESRVEFQHETYWLRREDGSLDGPFSTVPWDLERKLVRMHKKSRDHFGHRGECYVFVCPVHGKHSVVPVPFVRQQMARTVQTSAASAS